MAKQDGLGMACYIDGLDFSGDIGSISSIAGAVSLGDITGIDKSAVERIGLLRSGSIGFNSWFNPSTGQQHPNLSTRPTTDRNIVVATRITALGDDAAGLVCKQINYDANRQQDGSLAFTVEAQSNAFPLEWGEALTAGKRTDTVATNPTTGLDDLGGSPPGAVAKTITSSSVANPTVITATAHGFVTGDSIVIAGHTGSTPALDGAHTVTVTGANTFTVPVNVTVGGTGGTATKTGTTFGATVYVQLFSFTGTSVTFTLRDATIEGTYAAVTGGAGTAMTALGAQRFSTSSTQPIRRYLSIGTSGTFSNAVFFVVVVRHLAASI